MYNVKSRVAEEFIDDAEILATLEYAQKHNLTITNVLLKGVEGLIETS